LGEETTEEIVLMRFL